MILVIIFGKLNIFDVSDRSIIYLIGLIFDIFDKSHIFDKFVIFEIFIYLNI